MVVRKLLVSMTKRPKKATYKWTYFCSLFQQAVLDFTAFRDADSKTERTLQQGTLLE